MVPRWIDSSNSNHRSLVTTNGQMVDPHRLVVFSGFRCRAQLYLCLCCKSRYCLGPLPVANDLGRKALVGSRAAEWVRAAGRDRSGIARLTYRHDASRRTRDLQITSSHFGKSQEVYQESKMTLGFTLADSRPQTVPNSDFLTSLSVRPIDEKIELKGLVVNFGPRSGERLAQRQKCRASAPKRILFVPP